MPVNYRTKVTGYHESEKGIQTGAINYLRMLGWYCQRLNSGRIPMIGAGGSKRLIMLADPGTPDLFCFKQRGNSGHVLLFIEFKVPGKKSTPLQRAKQAELQQYGAITWEIHGISELQEKLKELS